MARGPGRRPSRSRSEVVTLAVFGQWARFRRERDFWRDADRRLRGVFPRLPDRAQLNRQRRRHRDAVAAFALGLAAALGAAAAPSENLDGTAVPTRNRKRRGRGWLPGLADVGWSPQRGWFEGRRLLLAVDPAGVVTGWGVGPASANDRALAEDFVGVRAAPDPRLPTVGRTASGVDAADTGFAGLDGEERWVADAGAPVVAPPQANAGRAWPAATRRRCAAVRHMGETVFDRLPAAFRLDRERPHDLAGRHARLAAKAARHHAGIGCNRQRGGPDLALADLPGW